ncbi:MAG: NAD(P)/FAD-dependent oxidoreductase [Acidobacteriota bacterium]
MSSHHDVIIIGGGPAGATVAALEAEAGRDVMVLERDTFPRFHIGESLMPATYWTFERLGVLDKLAAAGFVRKQSVQFFSSGGKGALPFYFSDFDPHPSSVSFQVERSTFDTILLEHAKENGAQVSHGVNVTGVLLEGKRVTGVRTAGGTGGARELTAPVVVDASGQHALLSRRFGLMRTDPRLRHCAYFTRFAGAARAAGRDEGATLILHVGGGSSWFWYIPLPGDRVSVGVVGHIDRLVRGRAPDPQQVFDEEAARCPALQERLAGATQEGRVEVQRDFSYAAKAIAGDGWVLAGDAFGFLDPIYSSGIFLALKGAEFAADSIEAAFDHDDFSATRLGAHGPEFIAGMEALRRLAYAYYDESFNFRHFLSRHPEHRTDLIHLLIGNVYRRSCTGIFESMNHESPQDGYEPLRLPSDGS